MENIAYSNIQIAGQIQHGIQEIINGKKRCRELKHFIAKTRDSYKQVYIDEFDRQYKGKQSIDIYIYNENPFTEKYVRYNQGGEACYRQINEQTKYASQRTSDGLKQIECDIEKCPYREKNKIGKMACNKVGWLRFIVPSICKDHAFLIKITGQKSLDRLRDFFKMQKANGQSLKGMYRIYLFQEEQTDSLFNIHYNWNLNILRLEDFNSNNEIPQTITQQEKSENIDKNNKVVEKNTPVVNTNVTSNQAGATSKQAVNNTVKTVENKVSTEVEENAKKTLKETSKKETNKKQTKSKSKKKEEQPKTEVSAEQTKEFDTTNCYVLLDTVNEEITNKKGEKKVYLVGNFTDMEDKPHKIVIKPEDAEELEKCDLGTAVRLNIVEKLGRKFALDLEYVQKLEKIAA